MNIIYFIPLILLLLCIIYYYMYNFKYNIEGFDDTKKSKFISKIEDGKLVGIDIIYSEDYDINNPPKIVVSHRENDKENRKVNEKLNAKVYPLIKNNKIIGFIISNGNAYYSKPPKITAVNHVFDNRSVYKTLSDDVQLIKNSVIDLKNKIYNPPSSTSSTSSTSIKNTNNIPSINPSTNPTPTNPNNPNIPSTNIPNINIPNNMINTNNITNTNNVPNNVPNNIPNNVPNNVPNNINNNWGGNSCNYGQHSSCNCGHHSSCNMMTGQSSCPQNNLIIQPSCPQNNIIQPSCPQNIVTQPYVVESNNMNTNNTNNINNTNNTNMNNTNTNDVENAKEYDIQMKPVLDQYEKNREDALKKIKDINIYLKKESDAKALAKKYGLPDPPAKYKKEDIDKLNKTATTKNKYYSLSMKEKSNCYLLLQDANSKQQKLQDMGDQVDSKPYLQSQIQTYSATYQKAQDLYNNTCT